MALDIYLQRSAIETAGIFNPDTVDDLLNAMVLNPTPGNLQEAYRRTQLEWVVMLILTIQIMHRQFIQGHAPCFIDN